MFRVHKHAWKEVTRNFYNTSKKGKVTTIITYQCEGCAKLKQVRQTSFTSDVNRPDKAESC